MVDAFKVSKGSPRNKLLTDVNYSQIILLLSLVILQAKLTLRPLAVSSRLWAVGLRRQDGKNQEDTASPLTVRLHQKQSCRNGTLSLTSVSEPFSC